MDPQSAVDELLATAVEDMKSGGVVLLTTSKAFSAAVVVAPAEEADAEPFGAGPTGNGGATGVLGGLTGREGERGLTGRAPVGGETGGLIGGETGGLTGGETGRPLGAATSAGLSRGTSEGTVNAAKVETGDQVEDTAEELCEAEQFGAVMLPPE